MCSPTSHPKHPHHRGLLGTFYSPTASQHQRCLLSAECPVEARTAGSMPPHGKRSRSCAASLSRLSILLLSSLHFTAPASMPQPAKLHQTPTFLHYFTLSLCSKVITWEYFGSTNCKHELCPFHSCL